MRTPSDIAYAARQRHRFRCLTFILSGLCCVCALLKVPAAVADALSDSTKIAAPAPDGAYHVFPGDDIQAILECAAADPKHKRIIVHTGTYRPAQHGQAMIWFNARHDGITLEAQGEVTLTAANPKIADPAHPAYPAVVNHVVYFGDGINRRTVLRGFKITGANGYVTLSDEPVNIQPDIQADNLKKAKYFYTDGGGIKIFGRSYPTLDGLEISSNYASPCGAGVSVEHRGYIGGDQRSVLIRNCILRSNRSPVTGAAVDLLNGSAADITNCLFVGNLSNEPLDAACDELWKAKHGSGALTLFPGSQVRVRRCTFTGNRNGIDDAGKNNLYEDSIFWMNNAAGGWPPGAHYELDICSSDGIKGCFVGGGLNDICGNVDTNKNVLGCEDPKFDEHFVPQAKGFEKVGYRPAAKDEHTESKPDLRRERTQIHIEVRGDNYRWFVRYPGADDVLHSGDDIVVQRDLILPIHVDTHLHLKSNDLVYSLSLPHLGLKEIAVPELDFGLNFKPEQVGTFALRGDQLCGYSHTNLIGQLIVKSADDFDAWLEAHTDERKNHMIERRP